MGKKRNAYAAKLMAAKGAVTQKQRAELVHRCITTIYQAAAIALNELYGFGPERISRFRDALDRTILEYGGLMDGVDVEYADGKLEERFRQIMGDPDERP